MRSVTVWNVAGVERTIRAIDLGGSARLLKFSVEGRRRNYWLENCAQTVPKHPEYPLTVPHGTASSSPLSRCKHCVLNMYEVGDRDSKSADRKVVGVRPPSRHHKYNNLQHGRFQIGTRLCPFFVQTSELNQTTGGTAHRSPLFLPKKNHHLCPRSRQEQESLIPQTRPLRFF
jgi:hypothetical protein